MQPGAVVAGRFRIERVAGEGGMATVYRAHDTTSGQPVALKMLRAASEDTLERFVREARLLAGLTHEGVVRLLAHGRAEDHRPFLALEWLDGETLAARIARGPLDPAGAAGVVRRAADALAAVHAAGVVHRDVKPTNLFLVDGRLDRVKLLDFGVARASFDTARTATGTLLGTVGYLSPEQVRGTKDVGARADLYALGCVLFECLTGRLPFEGRVPTAILVKILLDDAPRASELRPTVPAVLDDLVARLLSRDAAARPASAVEVSDALAAIGPDAPEVPWSAPERISTGDRRLVAIVFAAAPGASGPEPDDAVRDAAARHGASLDRLADGSFVACLRGGVATDLALRAARCALALQAGLGGRSLGVTMGLASVEGRLPVGEAVDRAVALAGGDAPGPIRIDETTAGLLGGRFVVHAPDAEGAFELSAERDRPDGARRLLGRETPLVGRSAELGLLAGTLDACIEEGTARAIVLRGPAGIGKSRLRRELVRRARGGAEVWTARCDPMGAGSAFGTISRLVSDAAGLGRGEPAVVRRAKIEARTALVPGADRQRVSEFLGELVGAAYAEDGRTELKSARADPLLLGDQIRRAALDLFAATTAVGPLVLVVDDLQWGDLPSVQVLDAALAELAHRALLVLVLARPEVDGAFPGLFSGRRVTDVGLRELAPRACEKLVRAVLGDDASEEVVARIVERAAGHPFYLEELVRTVAEGRDASLPPTVLAMAQARIDALSEPVRAALRAASVFGEVFWSSGVRALVGGAADDWESRMDALVSDEVATARGESRFRGERELAFRHSLLREAAYAGLEDAERAVGHRLAAQWLEGVGERDPVVLAGHLEAGGEPGRAARHARHAAEQALEGNDFAAVVAWGERAARLGAVAETLGDVRRLQAEAHRWRGEERLAIERGEEAMHLLPPGSALHCRAAGQVAMAAGDAGDREVLARVSDAIGTLVDDRPSDALVVAVAQASMALLSVGEDERGRALLSRVERVLSPRLDPLALARVHYARAVRAMNDDDPAGYLEATREALESASRAGDARAACAIRGNLGRALRLFGRIDEAEAILRRARADVDRMGLKTVGPAVGANLAMALSVAGRHEEAATLARTALDDAVARGLRRIEGGVRSYLASILLAAGDPAGALEEARRALDVPSHPRSLALATIAAVRLAKGDAAGAAEGASEAIASVAFGGEDEGEALARTILADARAALGDASGAAAAWAEAAQRLRARADRIRDPALRRSFLQAKPEHVRIAQHEASDAPG